MGAAFNPGEMIKYRVLFDKTLHIARVVNDDGSQILLRTDAEAMSKMSGGRYIVISVNGSTCYSQVVVTEHNIVTVMRLWEEKRGSQRVDDVIPVIYRIADEGSIPKKARLVQGYRSTVTEGEAPDDTVNPHLRRQLATIESKLNLILERLHLHDTGFLNAEHRQVNISASGIRFVTEERFDTGAVLEVKMILPPSDGVVCYGAVVRATETEGGQYDTALHFLEMDEEVKEKIVYHVLNRQRNVAMHHVQKNGGKR